MLPSLQIVGRRITLRLAVIGDAEAMMAALQPDTTQNLQFFTEPTDLQRQVEYLQRMYLSPFDVLFAIVRQSDNVIVGTVGLHEIDTHLRLARLGVLVFRLGDRIQGYADEALRMIIEYAFTDLGLNKVHVNPFADDRKHHFSYFESLGFVREGVLREEYLLNGVYHDLVRMSLLAREWRAAHD
jgi:[ribosomal protein S5]-alanine N-acetyltransferase